jgi:peptidoglycan hydrolase-like protein with peptidoglycan-binding domain
MWAIVLLIAALIAGSASAAPAPAKKTANPDPVAGSYAAIPAADRMAIQADLIWTGDYNGIVDGEFGERAVGAVKAFQKRSGGKETGILNPPERAALAAAAKAKQDAVGWRMVDDGATGAHLGVPAKLVPQSSRSTTGSRWTLGRGEAQVETFRVADPGTTLKSVFETQKAMAGRQIAYNVLRPDFFVISGRQGLRKFYVRAHARDSEVRGVSVVYDQAMEGTWDPLVIAISNAFTAFPAALERAPAKRQVDYGTGVVVSAQGHVVTDGDLADGCNVLAVQGHSADVLARDEEAGLALLRLYGVSDLEPIAFSAAGARTQELTLVGIADPQTQGGRGVVTTPAARTVVDNGGGTRLEPSPAPGFAGGAAVDSQGRLVGIVRLRPQLVAGAGPGPSSKAELIPLTTIGALLRAHGIQPASPPSSLAQAKGSVGRVICVRK